MEAHKGAKANSPSDPARSAASRALASRIADSGLRRSEGKARVVDGAVAAADAAAADTAGNPTARIADAPATRGRTPAAAWLAARRASNPRGRLASNSRVLLTSELGRRLSRVERGVATESSALRRPGRGACWVESACPAPRFTGALRNHHVAVSALWASQAPRVPPSSAVNTASVRVAAHSAQAGSAKRSGAMRITNARRKSASNGLGGARWHRSRRSSQPKRTDRLDGLRVSCFNT